MCVPGTIWHSHHESCYKSYILTPSLTQPILSALPPPHYSQPKGQIPDYTAPVVLHDQAPSIEDFCNKLHKQLVSQLKYAWVWGSSVRHQPQKVNMLFCCIFVTCLWCCVCVMYFG